VSRRAAFLKAARVAVDLIKQQPVAERWSEQSALPKMSVGALANHLAVQVVSAHATASAPAPEPPGPSIPLLEHYARAAWVGADLDDEANVSIRERAEHSSTEGHAALVERADRALAGLRPWPKDAPPTIAMPWWEWSLSADDFLATRMMELMVHTDDLAVSVGVPTPEFPRSVARPVLTLLTALAEQKHGQAPLIRALTRAERAPASITVF
jgi:hypothetical protein